MTDYVTWDSPGGWAEFAPPCTCTHPLAAHNQHTKARACSVWSGFGVYVDPVKCPCEKYTAGDPKDWPPARGAGEAAVTGCRLEKVQDPSSDPEGDRRMTAVTAGADAILGEAAHYCGPGYGTCGEVSVGKDYAADLAALVVDAIEPLIRADERDDLRAKVEALPVTHSHAFAHEDSVSLSDVLALFEGGKTV